MKKMLVMLTALAFAVPSYAANIFVGCNLKGLEKMSPEQQSKVFFSRLGNKGNGNGGESLDILVDLATGNTIITCVKTADENAKGNLYVQVPGAGIIPLGPWWGEVDPNDPNAPQ